ncbi:MAG: hypothetical protein M3Y64_07050, partial [Gemmatimonadota bacterium]|nr:hypothetical protein [Gemmatimonadota bacterium]
MASPDINIGPTGPPQPIPASRALTRVTPVAPQPVTNPDGAPLGRSGITTRDLLSAPDLIVVRSKTPAIALGMGLEQARGALIRNQPTDALMALDEVWEGARTTETGWYLRGGSLALLGLPIEAMRVANELLNKRANSTANQYLLSLAKLALSDVSGARAALVEAITRRPGDALLMVQEALLLARQGNREDAENLFATVTATFPEHPAIVYGRTQMRQALRDGARVFDDPLNALLIASRTPRSQSALNSIDIPDDSTPQHELGTPPSGDVVQGALTRFGARLPLLSDQQSVAECRALLIGLSSGGPLAASVSAARAFAARSVIGAILDALQNSDSERGLGWDAQSVDGQWQRAAAADRTDETNSDALHVTVRALVAAMKAGGGNEIEAILRRPEAAFDDHRRALLREFAGLVRAPHVTPPFFPGIEAESG